MQQTQVLAYRIEGVLADQLRELAQTRRFWLREVSQLSACTNLLQSAPPSVMLMRLGSHLEKELELLEQVHAVLPQTAVIAMGAADNPALEGLVWELGATYAIFPPAPPEILSEILVSLLQKGPA